MTGAARKLLDTFDALQEADRQELSHDALLAMIHETRRQAVERDALYNPIISGPLPTSKTCQPWP
jgi:2-iminoacetate synthase ThiH